MKHYFECDCGSDEHRFCVTSEESEDDIPPQLYFHIQMSQYRNLLQRIVEGVRYILGHKSRYGHWDTINISPDDAARLIVLLHQHRAKLSRHPTPALDKAADRC